jgi:hypothetical protein
MKGELKQRFSARTNDTDSVQDRFPKPVSLKLRVLGVALDWGVVMRQRDCDRLVINSWSHHVDMRGPQVMDTWAHDVDAWMRDLPAYARRVLDVWHESYRSRRLNWRRRNDDRRWVRCRERRRCSYYWWRVWGGDRNRAKRRLLKYVGVSAITVMGRARSRI